MADTFLIFFLCSCLLVCGCNRWTPSITVRYYRTRQRFTITLSRWRITTGKYLCHNTVSFEGDRQLENLKKVRKEMWEISGRIDIRCIFLWSFQFFPPCRWKNYIYTYRFVLYVNGEKIVTDVKVNDGYWHFLCVTWESEYGTWRVFVDGILRDNGIRLAQGTVVQGKVARYRHKFLKQWK